MRLVSLQLYRDLRRNASSTKRSLTRRGFIVLRSRVEREKKCGLDLETGDDYSSNRLY